MKSDNNNLLEVKWNLRMYLFFFLGQAIGSPGTMCFPSVPLGLFTVL